MPVGCAELASAGELMLRLLATTITLLGENAPKTCLQHYPKCTGYAGGKTNVSLARTTFKTHRRLASRESRVVDDGWHLHPSTFRSLNQASYC